MHISQFLYHNAAAQPCCNNVKWMQNLFVGVETSRADGRTDGRDVCFVLSVNPTISAVHKQSSAVLSAANNKRGKWVSCHASYTTGTSGIGFFDEKRTNAGRFLNVYNFMTKESEVKMSEHYTKECVRSVFGVGRRRGMKIFQRFVKCCCLHLRVNESGDIGEGVFYRSGGVWNGDGPNGYPPTHHPLPHLYKGPRLQLQRLLKRQRILLYAAQHPKPIQRTGNSREILKIIIAENSRWESKQRWKKKLSFSASRDSKKVE